MKLTEGVEFTCGCILIKDRVVKTCEKHEQKPLMHEIIEVCDRAIGLQSQLLRLGWEDVAEKMDQVVQSIAMVITKQVKPEK